MVLNDALNDRIITETRKHNTQHTLKNVCVNFSFIYLYFTEISSFALEVNGDLMCFMVLDMSQNENANS